MNAYRHEMNIIINQLKDKENQLRKEIANLNRTQATHLEEKAVQDNTMKELK